MTALNFMHLGDRAVLMMDSAAIEPDGRVHSLDAKGILLPQWGGFIASLGPLETAKAITQVVIPRFDGIDDLAEHGEASFRAAREVMIERYPMFLAPWSVLVTGWSKSLEAPRAVAFASNLDIHFEADVQTWVMPFLSDERHREFFLSIAATGGRKSFDPVRHGLPLMEAQRRKTMKPAEEFAPGCHFVGGSVQVTEIDRRGVSQRIIHTWPEDKVGEKIQPAEFYDLPAKPPADAATATGNVLPMLSRQQRRALARQQQKQSAA